MEKNDNYYIDKEELYNEIKKYKESGSDKIPESIGKAILEMATNAASHWKYANYPFKEELIADAVYDCVKGVDKFNLDDDAKNAFGYFTIAIWRAFWRRISTEKDHLYAKYKIQLDGQHVLNSTDNESDITVGNVGDFHRMQKFVYEYEQNKEKKEKKKRERKNGNTQ